MRSGAVGRRWVRWDQAATRQRADKDDADPVILAATQRTRDHSHCENPVPWFHAPTTYVTRTAP